MRQLVDCLLRGKSIVEVERRTQSRASQITGHRHRVTDDAAVGDHIHRTRADRVHGDRIAAFAALRRGRVKRQIIYRRPGGPAVLPAMIFIGQHVSAGIDRGAHLGQMRGPVIVPAMFVPAHELHANRLAHRLRQNRGGLRGIVVTAAAERPRAFVILHADFFDRQPDHRRELGARTVNVLGPALNQCSIRGDVGNRAIGRERDVPLIGTAVSGRCDMRRCHEALRNVAYIGDNGIGCFRCPHPIIETGSVRQGRALLPDELELASSLDGIPFALGDHSDEVALAHDSNAGNVGDRALIDAHRFRAGTIGALSTGQHDAAVPHARHAQLLNADELAAHLVRNVDTRHRFSHEGIAARRFARRRTGDLRLEQPIAQQLAIGDGAGRLAHGRSRRSAARCVG